MENFPQSFEPVGSDSILEQFVQLKNFTNEKFESNEYVKTTVQALTEEEKKQARDNIGAGSATLNVIDNLESVSTTDALSANQGRILDEKNSATNQQLNLAKASIISLNSDVSEIQGNITSINQELQNTLKLPSEMPTEIELVGIGTNKAQTNLIAGSGISFDGTVRIADVLPVALNTLRNNQHDTGKDYYVSSDGKTIYKIYASGLKVVLINYSHTSSIPPQNITSAVITLPIEFTSKDYFIFTSGDYGGSASARMLWSTENKTVNNFTLIGANTATSSTTTTTNPKCFLMIYGY